ncbi:hypothetical protein RD792_009287 [Penstemon davidsonii]|uniref:Uncharacterized protein n=1 Tax=Penstemon davidsonii TaxID=160366 RepID=A0ABR0CYM4_9LAMI|nr:hypothetical protein RD792_009287 [Penstemon davidsonii]
MGRAPCCEKVGLKRGRWTEEEDEILRKYIEANGEGSWRSLPKNAGLLRCGKSCRLRWINYLRSDLKRGNISPKEEEIIVNLHASLGNKKIYSFRHPNPNFILPAPPEYSKPKKRTAAKKNKNSNYVPDKTAGTATAAVPMQESSSVEVDEMGISNLCLDDIWEEVKGIWTMGDEERESEEREVKNSWELWDWDNNGGAWGQLEEETTMSCFWDHDFNNGEDQSTVRSDVGGVSFENELMESDDDDQKHNAILAWLMS